MTAKTYLVTGATSGIGFQVTQSLRKKGIRVLSHGRKALAEAAHDESRNSIIADLLDPDSHSVIDDALRDRGVLGLDAIIHNAAIGFFGSTKSQGNESIEDLVRVNLEAPMDITRALLPRLIQSRGQIVFVSSVVASLPGPHYAVYSATKAALEGFARSLRVELGSRVRVKILRPGATQTGFHLKSGVPERLTEKALFMDPSKVAEELEKLISSGGRRRTVGFANRLVQTVSRTPLIEWAQRGKGEPI